MVVFVCVKECTQVVHPCDYGAILRSGTGFVNVYFYLHLLTVRLLFFVHCCFVGTAVQLAVYNANDITRSYFDFIPCR